MKRTLFISSFFMFLAVHPLLADIGSGRQSELTYLLKQDCGSCHGLTLKGGLGPALLPENLQNKSKQLLIRTILEGRSGTAMPPWKNLLSAEEAGWLMDQLLEGLN